jgi:hypothetical protein
MLDRLTTSGEPTPPHTTRTRTWSAAESCLLSGLLPSGRSGGRRRIDAQRAALSLSRVPLPDARD